jgi:hypothetical protein
VDSIGTEDDQLFTENNQASNGVGNSNDASPISNREVVVGIGGSKAEVITLGKENMVLEVRYVMCTNKVCRTFSTVKVVPSYRKGLLAPVHPDDLAAGEKAVTSEV